MYFIPEKIFKDMCPQYRHDINAPVLHAILSEQCAPINNRIHIQQLANTERPHSDGRAILRR